MSIYEQIYDPCRVCGREPPHELRVMNQGVEGRTLLDFMPDDAALLGESLTNAEGWR